MNRQKVIQEIINCSEARSYLEIGVATGDTFLRIKTRKKIAVDPNYSIALVQKIKWVFKNFCNLYAKYYRVTSNYYFANMATPQSLHVVFIDGLHTYKQALMDVENSLINLIDKGIIVIHDCNPPHEAAAFPAQSQDHAASLKLPGWTGEWCGDVWKTICYLRSFRKDLNIFVLDCDYGIGIVSRKAPEDNLNLSTSEINKLTFDDFVANRERFLNLKPVEFLYNFLNDL